MKENIFLTGFSGSGKSTVGRKVASRLGWSFVDTDVEITRSEGRPISEIFNDRGEAYFRELETRCLSEICESDRQVVSTGGGIVTNEPNRVFMSGHGVIVCLEARPDTLYHRLEAHRSEGRRDDVRPLLEDGDPLARIRQLKGERQQYYALADWTVQTDRLATADATNEVLRGWKLLRDRAAQDLGEDANLAARVRTSSGDYPVWVGWDVLGDLGKRVQELIAPTAAYVITDDGAYTHARDAQRSIEAAGVPAHLLRVPSGEASKILETVAHIYDWLAQRRAERGHLVVAVGGGVIGDMAGFAAATFLRGMPLVQVPTSLLAMMDSAIGGKTGVDLPQGKNLVGAFYQPRFVLADVQVLRTLPERELTSGWAEAIKHGLILDEPLLQTFEANYRSIKELEPCITTDVIRRSVAVKAGIVSRDERETLGIRALLNYGHTIGHAIEAATGYGRFLHGEAVSAGMTGAADISQSLDLLTSDEVERQSDVLRAFGLPISCGDLDLDAVRSAMLMDKKTAGKTIRWILLQGIGNAVSRSDVSEELVDRALIRVAR